MHSNLNTVGNRLGSRPGSPAVLVWAAWIAISFVLALHASQRGLKSDYDAVGYAAWFNIVSSFSVGVGARSRRSPAARQKAARRVPAPV